MRGSQASPHTLSGELQSLGVWAEGFENTLGQKWGGLQGGWWRIVGDAQLQQPG